MMPHGDERLILEFSIALAKYVQSRLEAWVRKTSASNNCRPPSYNLLRHFAYQNMHEAAGLLDEPR